MMEFQTAEARVTAVLDARQSGWQERRDLVARGWRDARARLRELRASQRRAVLRYWASGVLPASHEYLATIVTEAQRGRCYWRELSRLRRMTLVRLGKMPNPWKKS